MRDPDGRHAELLGTRVRPHASRGLLIPGRVLNGKWTLGRLLGQGASGLVYEASHRNGIRAAVKILRPDLAVDDDRVARFLREGAIANHLEHVGVVRAFDDDRTEDGLVYVVFERLDGKPLSEILKERGPLSSVEALTLVDALLDVLVVAHARGVLHRDIKPANVYVLPDGSIKLIDFGLAKSDRGVPGFVPVPTAQGAILGSPGYMAPEQACGDVHRVDARSDLWSVAAVLFTMLTGRRVPSPVAPGAALPTARTAPVPPVRAVRAGIPDIAARIVDRGLLLDPEERFQTAARMQGAVRYARSSLSGAPAGGDPHAGPSPTGALVPSLPGGPVPSSSRRPARRRGRGLMAVVAVVAVVAVLALLVASSLGGCTGVARRGAESGGLPRWGCPISAEACPTHGHAIVDRSSHLE